MSESATFYFDILIKPKVDVTQKSVNQKQVSEASEVPVVIEAVFETICLAISQEPTFLGMHEGTVLSEEAFDLGLETESFTVDSGLAPRERDWVGHRESKSSRFYFSDRVTANRVRAELKSNFQNPQSDAKINIEIGKVLEQKVQDWNQTWKDAFTGVELSSFWILPPHQKEKAAQILEQNASEHHDSNQAIIQPAKPILWLNPGAGFGTGTHETTQLCLEFLGHGVQSHLGLKNKTDHFKIPPKTAAEMRGEMRGEIFGEMRSENPAEIKGLDFGSGSGILSIGLALLGVKKIDALEIDELANENARHNAELNQVEKSIQFCMDWSQVLSADPRLEIGYDIVVANILRPILIENAVNLVSRLKSPSILVLSGLVESDLNEIQKCFETKLLNRFGKDGFRLGEIGKKGDWRALFWTVGPA